MYDWCEAINALLATTGYSQDTLAKSLNCSQAFISQMSNGQKTRVTYELGERIRAMCVMEGIEISRKQKALN